MDQITSNTIEVSTIEAARVVLVYSFSRLTDASRILFNTINKAVYSPFLLPIILSETVIKSFNFLR